MNKFQELKKLLNFVFKMGPIMIVFEVIIVTIMSVAASQVQEIKSLWFGILIFSAVVYSGLKIFKFFYEKLFPKSLIESIENELKNENLSKGFARKSLVNEAISTSLILLNEQTCILTDKGSPFFQDINEVNSNMCDKDVEEGLKTLLNPMLGNIHHVLETTNSKFTIGAYLKSIATETPNQDDVFHSPGVFVLKDELGFTFILTKELMEMDEVKGDQLVFQSFIRSSLNNNRSETNNFAQNGNEFTLVTSTIPLVCDDDFANGVLFVISEKLENVPIDLEEILNIFSRIIANWISKYDECVWSRYDSKNEICEVQTEEMGTLVLYSNRTWKEIPPEPIEAKKETEQS